MTTMTLSEARHTLRIHQENHRRNVRLRLDGKPAPPSWEKFVERRINECKQLIADEAARDKECAGKQKYPSMAAAEAHLHQLRAEKSGLKHGSRVNAYACRFCASVHLGNSVRRKAA
jgi:hypothetical protein